MLSRSISFCFACTLAVFTLASIVYLVRARPLYSGFQSPERMADRGRCPLRPRTGNRLRRAQPSRPSAPSPVLVSKLYK
eukprot:6213565-Pleurochrysis_carterae.AAC.2